MLHSFRRAFKQQGATMSSMPAAPVSDPMVPRLVGAAALAGVVGAAYSWAPTHTPAQTTAQPPAETKPVGKNSLVANVLSSAIGGMVHAAVEQPVTTPIEASIT